MNKERDAKRPKKALWTLFGGLFVLVIVLVAGIIINLLNKKDDGCLGMTDSDEMRDCIEMLYDEDEEAAEVIHVEAKNRAFESGNYELFTDLTFDRAVSWSLEDACLAALEEMRDDRVEEMPVEDRAYYYGLAVQIAVECEFDDEIEYYQKIYERLMNSGEIETFQIPVGEEDYDVDEDENNDIGEEEGE